MKYLDILSKRRRKPRALAFVDYEHWYYSYGNLYHSKPNLSGWIQELEARYELVDLMVFGNFMPAGISSEVSKIRESTNNIIETQNRLPGHYKNMTDFVMLDYLYRSPIDRHKINTYILFTGDGHFQPVVKYLEKKNKKKVVIYGVKGAFSEQLKAAATSFFEVPSEAEMIKLYVMIVQDLVYACRHERIIPTFNGTMQAVASYNNIDSELVRAALGDMLEKGYIYQKERRVSFDRKVKIIAANLERLIQDGIWVVP